MKATIFLSAFISFVKVSKELRYINYRTAFFRDFDCFFFHIINTVYLILDPDGRSLSPYLLI